MINIKVLIPVAGKGSRSGLSYPKTLYKINNLPILVKILTKLKFIDKKPSVIVSPKGKKIISSTIKKYKCSAELITQKIPTGMGDAILHFIKSDSYKMTREILLIWGDVPFVRKSSFNKLIKFHLDNNNDFSFITGNSKKAYTKVKRNKQNKVIAVKETRNTNIKVSSGERDVGVFIFNKMKIFYILKQNKKIIKKFSKKENNFLNIIEILVKRGLKVEGLNIANQKEMLSFNKISDLKK